MGRGRIARTSEIDINFTYATHNPLSVLIDIGDILLDEHCINEVRHGHLPEGGLGWWWKQNELWAETGGVLAAILICVWTL